MNKQFIVFSAALFTLALLGACSDPRKQLGLTKNAPDEFKVVKNAPLEIPDEFVLTTPQPGISRPQEQDITQQAREVLLGETAENSSERTS